MAATNPALESLLKTQPSLWRGNEQYQQQDTIETGFAALDRALPGGGWSPGTLTELLVQHEGIGELSLLLPALKNITRQQQWTALVNPPHIPYAPALANAGIQLDRMLIVDTGDNRDDNRTDYRGSNRAGNRDSYKDTLWSTEQLLRAGLFTMVVCWLGKTGASPQRRLQLAAEAGRTLAIAYRPAITAKDASAAALRISLTVQNNSQHSEMILNILKSRGGKNQSVFIQANDFDRSQGVEWPGLNDPDPLNDPAG